MKHRTATPRSEENPRRPGTISDEWCSRGGGMRSYLQRLFAWLDAKAGILSFFWIFGIIAVVGYWLPERLNPFWPNPIAWLITKLLWGGIGALLLIAGWRRGKEFQRVWMMTTLVSVLWPFPPLNMPIRAYNLFRKTERISRVSIPELRLSIAIQNKDEAAGFLKIQRVFSREHGMHQCRNRFYLSYSGPSIPKFIGAHLGIWSGFHTEQDGSITGHLTVAPRQYDYYRNEDFRVMRDWFQKRFGEGFESKATITLKELPEGIRLPPVNKLSQQIRDLIDGQVQSFFPERDLAEVPILDLTKNWNDPNAWPVEFIFRGLKHGLRITEQDLDAMKEVKRLEDLTPGLPFALSYNFTPSPGAGLEITQLWSANGIGEVSLSFEGQRVFLMSFHETGELRLLEFAPKGQKLVREYFDRAGREVGHMSDKYYTWKGVGVRSNAFYDSLYEFEHGHPPPKLPPTTPNAAIFPHRPVASPVVSEGQVYLCNRISGVFDAPITIRDTGVGAGTQPGMVAQLCMVTNGSVTPVGAPVSFRSARGRTSQYFSSAPIVVPGTKPGQQLTFRVRAFNGSSYENSEHRGESEDFTCELGGGTAPPGDLKHLKGFTVQ